MKRKRAPREVVWRVMTYGPAATMAILAAGLLIWDGWDDAWASAVAYVIAAANMWLASRQILGNYRTGYYHGRMDLILERMGVQDERGRDNPPGPWDDPMSDATLAAMRLAQQRAEQGDIDPE